MEKVRKYQHMSRAERLEISILLGKGYSRREIATALGRNHTSIVREINNRSVEGVYQPMKAQHKAYVKRKYSKYQGMKIRDHPELEDYIREKLQLDWSPEQIAGRLREVDTDLPYASHRVIYKYLYSPWGQPLCNYLRLRRYSKRRRRHLKPVREIIQNRTFITERPEVINRRERVGDFEVDRVESGARKRSRSGLVVAQDRCSRYYLAAQTSTKQAIENREAIQQLFEPLQTYSLTYDNDLAFRDHIIINQSLGSQSYFCLPHHPWEKGGLEYQNRLLRQYVPKGSDISQYTQQEINTFVARLNNRPRKCLNYHTPKEVAEAHHLFKSNYQNV